MDNDGLISALPQGDVLHKLNPAQRKKCVEDTVEVVLSAIERDHNAPDLWETEFLALAMASILRGQYWLAVANLQSALTPPNGRSPQAKLELVEPWPVHTVLATLAAVRAAPSHQTVKQ